MSKLCRKYLLNPLTICRLMMLIAVRGGSPEEIIERIDKMREKIEKTPLTITGFKR